MVDINRGWVRDGACYGEEAGEVFERAAHPIRKGGPNPDLEAAWAEAKAICKACPVMHQCRRDTYGEPDGIWGGLDPHERERVRKALPKAAARWPVERRLRFGRLLVTLTARMQWADVTRITGINRPLGLRLMAEYREMKPAARPKPKREAPPDRWTKPDFPQADGKKHMWIRDTRVRDAFYGGEDVTGNWVMAHVNDNMRGAVYKWVHRDDVRLYRDVPRHVVVKRGVKADEAA